MSRLILFAGVASVCWFAAEGDAGPSVAPGFLEGRLTMQISGGAKLAEEEPKAASVNYAEYPLTILRKENRDEIARITPDENGHYRIPLPPGDYLLEIKARIRKRVQTQQRPFTVVSQQTARVDMEILPDNSVSGAPR